MFVPLHPGSYMSSSYHSNLVSAFSFTAASTLDLPFLKIHHLPYSSSTVPSSLDHKPLEGSHQACLIHPRGHPAYPHCRQTPDSGETAVKWIHVSELLKIILWANWVVLPETWEPNGLFLLCLPQIQLGNEVWRAGTIDGDSGWGISAREPGQDPHCEIGTFSRQVILGWASSVPRWSLTLDCYAVWMIRLWKKFSTNSPAIYFFHYKSRNLWLISAGLSPDCTLSETLKHSLETHRQGSP